MQYSTLLECIYKNYNIPNKETIAYILVHSQPKNLTLKEISFQEHIWYLFQYECEIHNHFEKGSTYWESKFLELLNDTLLNKETFLNETLLTTVRFSNRSIPNYFFRILDNVNFFDQELLNSQENLLTVLNSQHSKPINQTLKYLKRIYKEPSFNLNAFIEQIPVLLSWDVKAIVNGTLGLIDALMKHYPEHKKELSLLSIQALAHQDESLQVKTIKLLQKYNLIDNQEIAQEIAFYQDNLFHSVKELLPEIESFEEKIDENILTPTPVSKIRENNRIPTYETFDELVFFFSQVFEGNNPYDFDYYIALLPKLHLFINESNASKLEPIFQQAYKCYERSMDNMKSEITFTMAQGMLYYGVTFLKCNSALHQKITSLYEKMTKGLTPEESSWKKSRLILFGDLPTSPTIFNIHRHLISNVLKRIDTGESSTPIFFPTYAPCWIDAKSLISRITEEEKNKTEIDSFEFQIAFSRTLFDNDNSIETLHGEMKKIFAYYCHNVALKITDISTPSLWLAPLLRKNNSQDLELFAQFYQKEQHDVNFSQIFNGVITHKNSRNTTFSSHCVQLIRTLSFDSIFHYTRLKSHYSVDFVDQSILLYLSPTLPNFILEALYKTPFIKFEPFMPSVFEIWNNFGDNVYLFVAKTFIDENKTTRQFSSELWIKATIEGTMNHQLLGETLGKLEDAEYAPLKRFTDLIIDSMLSISTLHNKALFSLLNAMLPQMNDEPIKGMKKLLEIYYEVLSITNEKAPLEVLEKLKTWTKVKSLSVIVKKIEKD